MLLQLRAQLMEAQVLLSSWVVFVPDYTNDLCIKSTVNPFFQFNECILLFSDMPAVDIDNVVSTSMEVNIA